MRRTRACFLLGLFVLLSGCGGSEQEGASGPLASGIKRAASIGTSQTLASSATQTVGSWQVTVTDLGLLPSGSMASARAINGTGKVVGIATDSTFALQRVVWDLTGGTIATLPNFDSSSSAEPESINDANEVSGTERISSTLSAGVYWDNFGSVYGLSAYAGGSSVQITAHRINKDGVVVGASREGAPNYFVNPVMWQKNATPVSLGFLGNGKGGEAFGINDFRHVVGVASNGSASRGFLWRGDKLVDLGAVGGSSASSRAVALNNLGIIAGTSDGDTVPVRWRYDPANASSSPALEKLPIPTGLVLAVPNAINDAGDIVGTATLATYNGTRAVLWRSGEAINLGTWPGGLNSRAFGINKAGQIVGEGDLNGDGRNHALLWTVTAANSTPLGPSTNTAPSVTLKATSSTSLRVGETVQMQGSFSDPDNGPWNYLINWGDGSSSSGSAASLGTLAVSHAYTKASPKAGFKAVLTVTDALGLSGSSSAVSVRVSGTK